MANEATVRISLQVRSGNLNYLSQPTYYTASVANPKGSTPGGILVTTAGVNLNLSQLTYPGLLWMQNLDISNYIEWGVHDGTIFHIIGRMLPGEIAHFRLSPDIGEEESATGTGTTAPINQFYLKANKAACNVRVDVFDS